MRKLSILFAALLLAGTGLAQQATFSKVYYDDFGNAQGYDVVPTFDHNYMVVGERDQVGLVMKINQAGDVLWSKTVSNDAFAQFGRIIVTSDSNYIMLGYCENSALNNLDVFLVKFNSDGDTLWTKAINMGVNERPQSIQQTFDKGFIISGICSQQTGTPLSLMFVIKLDVEGNLVWARKIAHGNWENNAFSVKQLPDSGYAVMGTTEDQVGSNFESKACLIKLLADGTISWAKSINPSSNIGYDLEITPTGILCFTTFSASTGFVFVKTDFSGNLLWSNRNYVYSDCFINNPAPKLSATSDGGFLYCASGYYSPGNVVKIDSSGTPVWCKQVYALVSRAIEIQNSGTMIVGNGPFDGVKTYTPYYHHIGIITLDSTTNSVSLCMINGFTSVDGASISLTDISCSITTGGSLEARHPIVSNRILDVYDGCVAHSGGVDENQAENSVTAYPNPNPGVFMLQMKTQTDDFSIVITDITGRSIYDKIITREARVFLDISDQPNGIYYLTLHSGTKQYRTKVVLLK
jgi:hypothetical protein